MVDSFEIRIDRSAFDLTPYCEGYRHTCDFVGRASDGFSCTIYHPDISKIRENTKPLLQIVFSVNGKRQFLGQIDRRTFADDGRITLTCSDYLANSVDCSVGKNITIPKGETLRAAILRLMQSQGVKTVTSGWNEARNTMAGVDLYTGGPTIDFAARKLSAQVTVKQDEGVWETVDKLCKLHHCTPKAGVRKDTLYLVAPEYRQSKAYNVTRLIGNAANNFRGPVSEDYSSFPTVFVATGSTGVSSEKKKGTYVELNPFKDIFGDVASVQNISRDQDRINVFQGRFDYAAGASPADVIYREMRITDTKSQTQAELQAVANRKLSEAIKDSLVLDGEIENHSLNGVIMTPDTIVAVSDEISGVFEDLWISGRDLMFDGSDQTCHFTAYRPKSFQL